MGYIKAKAYLNQLTKEAINEYYLRPQLLATLYPSDIIRRMESKQIATLNVNGEAFVNLFLAECIAAINEGYNVVTNLFQASIGIGGVVSSHQLGHAIPPEELSVRVHLTQGAVARSSAAQLTVVVAEQPAATGPIIQSVINPVCKEADLLNAGQMVLIQGMRLAVKGDKTDEIGVYFTKTGSMESIRIAANELSPNSPTKLQFVLPREITAGEWKVKVATQAKSKSVSYTKKVRVTEYANTVSVV
ncbi:MAG: DUF4469 domain-containing protein [Prevotellaceae bacterium]|jgi:hypothetical protein|nr:DUF4469 domain-containing protein [Prevotellaceae bacterium]